MRKNPFIPITHALSQSNYFTRLAERAFRDASNRKKTPRARDEAYDRAVEFAKAADVWAKRAERMGKSARKILGIKRPRRKKPEYVDDAGIPIDEDASVEWEFGFEYEGDSGKQIDVNFRLRRSDGKKFTKSDALDAMRQFVRSRGKVPRGYVIAGVDWRRPGRSFRWTGSYQKLQGSFVSNILEAVYSDTLLWRLGNPK